MLWGLVGVELDSLAAMQAPPPELDPVTKAELEAWVGSVVASEMVTEALVIPAGRVREHSMAEKVAMEETPRTTCPVLQEPAQEPWELLVLVDIPAVRQGMQACIEIRPMCNLDDWQAQRSLLRSRLHSLSGMCPE